MKKAVKKDKKGSGRQGAGAKKRTTAKTPEAKIARSGAISAADIECAKRADALEQRIRSQLRGHIGRTKNKTIAGRAYSSKYKGVTRISSESWKVKINPKGRAIYLGVFYDEKEAALAYDAAAREVWGDKARTNQEIYPEDFKEEK